MRKLQWLPASSELISEMGRVMDGDGPTDLVPWAILVVDLVQSNLRQWDLEDVTRDPGASDAVVAAAKREIDRLNMGRHHLVEQIDGDIDAALQQPADAPVATESPGMVLDRLSVLVIRRARTASASVNRPGYAARLTEVESQLDTLSAAFDSYLDELRSGSRRFVPYEHFKLYGSSAHLGAE